MEFLRDALRFVDFSITIVDSHPLQLYSHALLFAPENSLIKQTFKTHIPKWINPGTDMYRDWDSSLQVFAKPGYPVSFAPDTQVWDCERGVVRAQSEHGSKAIVERIIRVELSRDSTKLAVIYHNMTQIYDTTLGTLSQLSEISRKGHLFDGFSSNSKFILFRHEDDVKVIQISAFDASTGVCVWDSSSGPFTLMDLVLRKLKTVRGTYEEEDRRFYLAFSDDSEWLAVTTGPSCWSPKTRNSCVLLLRKVGDVFKLQHTLERSEDRVSETTFASNARVLASLNQGRNCVLVWKLQSPRHKPYVIEGCASIEALSHSFLAAKELTSEAICIWHIASGRSYKRLYGISGRCAFSSCERLLAVGEDGSVRILDWKTGVCLVQINEAYTSTPLLETELLVSFLPGDAGIQTQSGIVQVPKEILAPPVPPSSPELIRHTPPLSVDKNTGWVQWQGERLLKLPAEYDADNVVVSNTTIFIILLSHKVVMIRFRDSYLSEALSH